MIAYVEAPNHQLYFHWLAQHGYRAKDYPYIETSSDLLGYYGTVIVLNGGSHDARVRSLVNHPTRRGQAIYQEV